MMKTQQNRRTAHCIIAIQAAQSTEKNNTSKHISIVSSKIKRHLFEHHCGSFFEFLVRASMTVFLHSLVRTVLQTMECPIVTYST